METNKTTQPTRCHFEWGGDHKEWPSLPLLFARKMGDLNGYVVEYSRAASPIREGLPYASDISSHGT